MADVRESDPLFRGLRGFRSPPERTSLGQYVYENLKQAVVRGELEAGSRLVESRLAEALSMSRTPVREAFHKLEREHLIRRTKGGGFFVAGLTRADIEETFGIRSVLESYAARLAATKHQAEEIGPLERKIEEYGIYLDKGKTDKLLQINTEFHDLLYALSRSQKLIKMINDLRDQIYRFRKVLLKSKKMARASNEDHKLMLQFIKKRDAEGVEKLVREHILRGQTVILEEFDKHHPGKVIPELRKNN